MKKELTIFKDAVDKIPPGSRYEEVFDLIATLQDKVTTILLCSREELSYYLTSDDPTLRQLAEKRHGSYE